ncbi:unnamed protein product, partial [Discosporangium mesarthrocarpum]
PRPLETGGRGWVWFWNRCGECGDCPCTPSKSCEVEEVANVPPGNHVRAWQLVMCPQELSSSTHTLFSCPLVSLHPASKRFKRWVLLPYFLPLLPRVVLCYWRFEDLLKVKTATKATLQGKQLTHEKQLIHK